MSPGGLSKAFSFFSHVHCTYSRVDLFFVENRLLHWVNSSGYHSIVITDHAPTSVVINFQNCSPPHTQWKLSHLLLNNPHFKKFFQEEIITNFFQTNDTPDIARGTLWEVCKAYLRRQAISFASWQKKTDRERMVWLAVNYWKLTYDMPLPPLSFFTTIVLNFRLSLTFCQHPRLKQNCWTQGNTILNWEIRRVNFLPIRLELQLSRDWSAG